MQTHKLIKIPEGLKSNFRSSSVSERERREEERGKEIQISD
jgi:hypothetical protein